MDVVAPAVLMPFAGTLLGAAFVFLLRNGLSAGPRKALTGFAAAWTCALAGAMLYVVVEELVPELSEGANSNVGTVAFSVGFAAMTALDRMAG